MSYRISRVIQGVIISSVSMLLLTGMFFSSGTAEGRDPRRQEIIRELCDAGFVPARAGNGSHVQYIHPLTRRQTTVPAGARIRAGTAASIRRVIQRSNEQIVNPPLDPSYSHPSSSSNCRSVRPPYIRRDEL
jgi:predicted RNA binding protein YcfA (HicA-like mRNA interferase family)